MKTDRETAALTGTSMAPGEAPDAQSRHVLQACAADPERPAGLFDRVPAAYVTLEHDGTITGLNPAGSKLLGLPREELGGQCLRNFVAPGSRDDFDRLINPAPKSDTSQSGDLALRRADGRPLFAHIDARFDQAAGAWLLVLADITEHQQRLVALQGANAQLAALADEQAARLQLLTGELARAEQRERDRLYELLHDHIQPLLVAARLGLSGINGQTPQDQLLWVVTQANEQISQVIQTARTLSVELSPPLIREKGLIPALESLCRWIHAKLGLKVDMNCPPNTEPASMTIRLLCFTAVRELLMNVVKYAGTPCAVLDLEREPGDMLRITVRDDGVGFDPAENHGSGLANIARRLEAVGGRLSIDSRPNGGTIAIILAPVTMHAAEKRLPAAARVSTADDKTGIVDDDRVIHRRTGNSSCSRY